MNNKYDINNFAKFLESFSSAKEMERVDVFLQDGYMPVVGQPQFDFVEFNTQMGSTLSKVIQENSAMLPARNVTDFFSDSTTLSDSDVNLLITTVIGRVFCHNQLNESEV